MVSAGGAFFGWVVRLFRGLGGRGVSDFMDIPRNAAAPMKPAGAPH
jgi:hypothetical protein